MYLLAWILFGVSVGIVAHLIDTKPVRGGIMGAMVLGAVGAVIGGFVANILFGIQGVEFDLSSLIFAISASLLIVFIHRSAFTKSDY
jgi:uncharacterized membrane protein YeaQ/YmgE (transglycosylase-associated protein family)